MAPANCIELYYPQITPPARTSLRLGEQIAQIKKERFMVLKNNLCESVQSAEVL